MGVHFICGGLAGITAASATYPLDLIRTRLSAQRSTIYYQGTGHALRTICRDEGFFGLYKGMGATLLGVGPSIAISFSVYEAIRTHWHSKRPNDSTTMVSLASGSLSGLASSTVICMKEPSLQYCETDIFIASTSACSIAGSIANLSILRLVRYRISLCDLLMANELVLTFHSLNLSRSAYRSISLKPDLFDAYTISGGAKIQCSVLFKAICSVLRTAVASVDHLRVHLPSPVA
ncbi:hypothetical protein POM88_009620 [Heracleum sosnowskyi]|uniref:Mitochondrial substrate carrier family protein n=1 Tax=Heracleum sosnowskyi TaxID=360622 RepID=A0AAD8J8N5_9APIA|nr:hypothetical protein POM88_009620 [Heracleum sosnowskyi]